MIAKEVFVNCYNFNPLSQVQEILNYPEPQFEFAGSRSLSQIRKK
jgi:hypothetical protein